MILAEQLTNMFNLNYLCIMNIIKMQAQIYFSMHCSSKILLAIFIVHNGLRKLIIRHWIAANG